MGLLPEVSFLPSSGFVSTFSPECESGFETMLGGGSGSAGVVAQNRLYLQAVRIETPKTFTRMGWHNGATVAGNCAAGIYTMAGGKLDATAHTAQAGASVAQGAALTGGNVLLNPGLYYFVFGSDSATATFWATGANLNLGRIWGQAQVAAGYANPLPATLTPAWPLGSSKQPIIWAAENTVQ